MIAKLLVTSGAALTLACSASNDHAGDSNPNSGSGSNSSGANTGSGGSSGASNSAGGNSFGGLIIDVGGGAGGQTGNGSPEICDGIDNDMNGIIDDVDAGHDGVCDCLNIATIGHIGPWSNGGNVFASWLNARSPVGAVALGDEELSADKLKPFQIVVVLHVAPTEVSNNNAVAPAHHLFSTQEASAFEAWVRGGGGVMTTIGYTFDQATEAANVNKLLANLGLGYSSSKFDLFGNVTTWMTHPVSEGITNIYTDGGIEPDGPNGTTIATQDGSKIALQVAQVAQGRAAIWGDEWITYDSEWTGVKAQEVEHFWLNLLKWLSPPTQCQVPIPPILK